MLIAKDHDNTPRWKEGMRLNHMFEATVDRVPEDHVAVVTEDVSVTFRELDALSNQAARYLIEQGLKPGQRVGLLFDKTINSHIALLAVLKLGAAYVPLDASFPTERISFILEDAEVSTIVSVSRFEEKLKAFEARPIFIDTARDEIAERNDERLSEEEAPLAEEQLFYIIYTSGTTGKPKGVAIEHAGICNFCAVAGEVYGITESDRCYQGITLAFDFHVEDLWLPLIRGATLIAGKSEANLFGEDLHDFLKENRCTVFPCVPTLWGTVEADLDDIRIVILSGEEVPHHLVVKWHKEGRNILNAYGPTECSVSSTLRILTPDIPVTIGTPLPTYTALIVDPDKPELIAEGEVGEICIAGIALAEGYLNRPDLTEKTFIPDFVGIENNPSERIYRTGDLGRINEEGEIEFLGRIDTQVKVRGYRVELGEIEAVLMQVPEIDQVVVNPYEPEQGVVDLVAYYVLKPGADPISQGDVSELVRSHLPSYMVPGYLEELDAIPMTSNNKADRKNLPAPVSQRFVAAGGAGAAPKTETEKEIAAALTAVMGLEEVSIEDNFFQDLGAHSLLMAQFGTEIRNRMNVAAISIRDIYLNPTIEKLAKHVEALPRGEAGEKAEKTSNEAEFHFPSAASYYTCGIAQLAWIVGWGMVGVYVFVESFWWAYAVLPDLQATYVRLLILVAIFTVALSLLPVVVKWLVIGRWKPQRIPVWSFRYFVFWAVKTMVRSSPMASFGDPYQNLYQRLLGAKIGANTVFLAKEMPICSDLVSIGANTIVNKDSIVNGYKAQNNYIHIGPIHIGDNAFVGEAAVIDINTRMEDNTQLGFASSLHDGQTIAEGKNYHGTPAVETTTDYCTIEPMPCGAFRRWAYATVPLIFGILIAPAILLAGLYAFPYVYDYLGGDLFSVQATAQDHLALAWKVAAFTFVGGIVGMIAMFLWIGTVPHVLNLLLTEDRTYPLYGFHYMVQKRIERWSNSEFFNNVFGDSSAIVYYMKWVGWELNTIVQTGSNFGSDQRHDNPFMCDIGTGTMVSGGLKMINESTSASSFRLNTVKVHDNNYLGNYVHIPAESKIGRNVLIGTKMLVPIDGPMREDVGLLGSPSFEIPRAAQRDLEMGQMDEETAARRLAQKNRYNFVSSTLFLLNNWFVLFLVSYLTVISILYTAQYDLASLYIGGFGIFAVLLAWMWFVERASLKFGTLQPRIVQMLDPYYWFHERHKLVSLLHNFEDLFAGTPFKNFISRLEGVKVGKMVFDDGFEFNEYTLIEIGDYANLNDGGLIQPHTLEEGVFKSDFVKIGKGCTLGSAVNLHYGVNFDEFVVLDPNSFVMKGETARRDTTWQGNPARSISD